MKVTKIWLSGYMDGRALFGMTYRPSNISPNILIPFRPHFLFRLTIINDQTLMSEIGAFMRKNIGVKVTLTDVKTKDWGYQAQKQYFVGCNIRDDVYKIMEYFLPLLRSNLRNEVKQMMKIIEFRIAHQKSLTRDLNVFLTFARMVDEMRMYRPKRNTKYNYHYFLERYGQEISSHPPIETLNKAKDKV